MSPERKKTPVEQESFLANIGSEELDARRKKYLEKVAAELGYTPENSDGLIKIEVTRQYAINQDGTESPTNNKQSILYVRDVPQAIVIETVNSLGYVYFNANFLTKGSRSGLARNPGKRL